MLQKKICMIGAYGVGKTSMVRRYVQSIFDERYQTTVGVKIDKKQVTVQGQDLTLVIWDMAGEDGLVPMRLSQVRGAAGYLLVADGCREETLAVAVDLHERITDTVGDLPFLLALNKHDLQQEWRIREAAIHEIERLGWRVMRTSAKSGSGVEELFQTLALRLLDD